MMMMMQRQLQLVLLLVSSLKCHQETTRRWVQEEEETYKYVNWHRSINVGGPFKRLFRPVNDDALIVPLDDEGEGEGDYYIQDQEFLSGLHAIQDIVEQAAFDGNKRLRAYGSRWSQSDITTPEDYAVECWGLNYYRIGLDHNHVVPAYSASKDRLVFVQSGVMVKHINQKLLEQGLAFSTTGDADGQRVVGAIATGTHNSALELGSMQDSVKGIHLVISTNNTEQQQHVYIQRSSDRVTTDDFAKFLGSAHSIYSDDLFDAALVGVGSYGIIHGVLVETEPLFHLTRRIQRMSWPDVRNTALTLDGWPLLGIEGLRNDEKPFHFSVYLSPYRLGPGQKGAWVETYQKYPGAIPAGDRDGGGGGGANGDRLMLHQELARRVQSSSILDLFFGILERFGALGRALKRLIFGLVVSIAIDVVFPEQAGLTLYPSEHFSFSGTDKEFGSSLDALSTDFEMGVPLECLSKALDIVFEVLHSSPYPCIIRLRYGKKSSGLLAMSRYNVTSIVNLLCPQDSFFFPNTRQLYEKMFQRLEAHRETIPHTFHLGKQFPVNNQWVERAHGEDFHKWKTQREGLMNADGRNMFASQVLEDLGLHS